MSCLKVQKLISPFLDQRLAGEMREYVLAHLAECRECAAYADSLDQTRHVLRALPERPVPERLAGALRVLASHEYQRRLYGGALHATLRAWRERFQLMTDNLMRPLALPFAGGLLSALVLFCMLVPTLGFQHNFRNDVPIASGYTNPSLQEISPFCYGMGAEESVVEITLDEHGHITDYRMSEGRMTKELANDLLFSRFAPATLFGQPVPSKFRLGFRRSRMIEVKG